MNEVRGVRTMKDNKREKEKVKEKEEEEQQTDILVDFRERKVSLIGNGKSGS
ncbi:unnamed protein product [Wuchereria bancrofti]|uniref:Uncharacterized protein n=1 Tax=Wuchereria bancrofti TaxID=6293 RepID=A0A3P7E566_WUCBA|nr:unnamed protein product [Wuchereria bancrofti]